MKPITIKVTNGMCTVHYEDHVDFHGRISSSQLETLMEKLEENYTVFLQID